jgi:hypothetical protein
MHGFVTACTPASATAQAAGGTVIRTADNDARGRLLLEMTLKAKIRVTRNEHLLVHSSVRIVTGGASLADRFVFKDKRAALRGMAFAAGIVLGKQGRSTAADCRAFMGIMTITAAYFAVQHGMAMGKLELRFFVEVALEANVRRLFGIDDRMMGPSAVIVNTAGSVAGFATDVLCIWPFGFEAGVRGGFEITHDLGMTIHTTLRADEFGSRDLRWSNHGASDGGTRD